MGQVGCLVVELGEEGVKGLLEGNVLLLELFCALLFGKKDAHLLVGTHWYRDIDSVSVLVRLYVHSFY